MLFRSIRLLRRAHSLAPFAASVLANLSEALRDDAPTSAVSFGRRAVALAPSMVAALPFVGPAHSPGAQVSVSWDSADVWPVT